MEINKFLHMLYSYMYYGQLIAVDMRTLVRTLIILLKVISQILISVIYLSENCSLTNILYYYRKIISYGMGVSDSRRLMIKETYGSTN